MLLLKGEVWTVAGRKGRLTVKLLDDVETKADEFFDAELIEGTPVYLSIGATPERIGETVTLRTTMTQFMERKDD